MGNYMVEGASETGDPETAASGKETHIHTIVTSEQGVFSIDDDGRTYHLKTWYVLLESGSKSELQCEWVPIGVRR